MKALLLTVSILYFTNVPMSNSQQSESNSSEESNIIILQYEKGDLKFKQACPDKDKGECSPESKGLQFNFNELKIKIEGNLEGFHPDLRVEGPGGGSNLIDKEKYTDPEKKKENDYSQFSLTDLISAIENLPPSISLIFLAKETELLVIPIAKAKDIEDPLKDASLCKNPIFYQSNYLTPSEKLNIGKVPFYVIEHDFSQLNNGPRILKYERLTSAEEATSPRWDVEEIKEEINVLNLAAVNMKSQTAELDSIKAEIDTLLKQIDSASSGDHFLLDNIVERINKLKKQLTQVYTPSDNSRQVLFQPLRQSQTFDRDFKITEKRTLNSGSMATLVFKYHIPNYEKITHTITFKDYNQEGQTMFQSYFMDPRKEGQTSPASIPVTKTKGGLTAVDESVLNSLSVLNKDLNRFLTDIYLIKPSTELVELTLSTVKQNIRSCFNLEEEFNNESFINHITKISEDSATLAQTNQVFLLLWKIARYSAITPPTIQVKNADELVTTVNYFYKDDDNVPLYTREYDIPILGGFKLDFSTGVIFSDLVDNKYLITDSDPHVDSINLDDGTVRMDTTSMKRIIKEDINDFQMGVGILAHFYRRLFKWISISATSGVIVKDDLAVQFPMGGSLLIGRQSRLVLSSGWTFGQKKVLSSKYQLDTPVKASSLENITENQLLVDKFSNGWFFALTYNFGGSNIGGNK